jgi:hypothetical protein
MFVQNAPRLAVSQIGTAPPDPPRANSTWSRSASLRELMHLWSEAFREVGVRAGQTLLTDEVITERSRYLNARRTFGALFPANVVPIVNENDAMAGARTRSTAPARAGWVRVREHLEGAGVEAEPGWSPRPGQRTGRPGTDPAILPELSSRDRTGTETPG